MMRHLEAIATQAGSLIHEVSGAIGHDLTWDAKGGTPIVDRLASIFF